MGNLKSDLQRALKDAMKAKDRERRDAIRLLHSAIKQVEIDEQEELDDDGVLGILQKQAKQRRETISELEGAGRSDEAAAEFRELTVIEEFLPRQLSPEELTAIVRDAITEVGADSMKQMGPLMRVVMPKVQGRADGKAVNAVAKELLS